MILSIIWTNHIVKVKQNRCLPWGWHAAHITSTTKLELAWGKAYMRSKVRLDLIPILIDGSVPQQGF